MKIAQVSPLFERVPPKAYGGTERIISYLTEELVNQGHDVTLFATEDSITQAKLIPAAKEATRQGAGRQSWLAYHTIQMNQLANMASTFDVIHFHTDYLHLPLARRLSTSHITTIHGRVDFPELVPLYQHFKDCPLVSISDSQRSPLPWANWLDTVPHGLPKNLYSFKPTHGDYFAFVGRISPEKRVDRAIEIAQQCGKRLYIAAKIDKVEETYFNECIKPLMHDPLIEYIGEVGDHEKRELLEHASALLFPIDWPEPFGLVMIEGLACGTPVIAYENGSVGEILDEGVTGFIVNNQKEAISAAQRIDTIDRRRCREAFEQRFTVEKMAENYVRLYQRLGQQFLSRPFEFESTLSKRIVN